MNPKARQVLAGDTNGMDLAQGSEWVVDALSTIRKRLIGSSLLIPPTVSEELGWLTAHGEEALEPESARTFLRGHRGWGFQLLHTEPLGEAYVGRIART